MRRLAWIPLASLLLVAAAPPAEDRIRFTIRCVEERHGARHTLYQADVDGAPGTDFTIRLRDRGFALDATFVNDPTSSGDIDVRASLTTRRRHGTSPAGLPLWEEDAQQHRFAVRFDQEIELLPFGGAGAAGLLKFDIRPQRSRGAGPMQIHINDFDSRGAISVDAYRQPHWYAAEAEVVSDGRVVARAASRIFTGTTGRLDLPPFGGLAVTPNPIPRGDPWRSTDVTVAGPWFPHTARAVSCGDAWLIYALDAKRTLRVRAVPADAAPLKGECS
jgi:hypothetical protein